jgi:hypothetical protein
MIRPAGRLGRRAISLATLSSTLALLPGAAAGTRSARQTACTPPELGAAYNHSVERALRARRDVWGEALLASRVGPTYAGAARYLKPLLLARAPKQTALTASGVHYVAFSRPRGADGTGVAALHVADGSQILAQRIGGASVSVAVGQDGRESYGSCLARLQTPRLADGYLPILETDYVDGEGARYGQESFATRIPQLASLVSLVRLHVDTREAETAVRVRFTPSAKGLTAVGNTLRDRNRAQLVFETGGSFDGTGLMYAVPRGTTRTFHVAFVVTGARSAQFTLDAAAYQALRTADAAYWNRRLLEGAQIDVPERTVLDAARSVLIQDIGLTWRYSIGNPYQEFSFPEGVDVAQVLSSWGHAAVARRILETSLSRRPRPYPNWKRGQKLVGWALHYRLFRDRAAIVRAAPALRGYVAALGRQLAGSPLGLLYRERYSSDIPDQVYGLHSQAVVWQGLRSMADVWSATGNPGLAHRAERLADSLEVGVRTAVRRSQTRMPDGSLFLPVRLLDGEQPYDRLTTSRPGSYWNLVAPYALASGLFPRGSPQATGALRYLLGHGSRLLGLVRAGAFALYGRTPLVPESGTDQVYGVNVARFLALNDRPDQLVLSLYGQRAAGMTPGTFVGGEAASVAPIQGEQYRSMYLPPNGAANAAFLETLRLMLVHEVVDRRTAPVGLELAFATPRAWLAPGRHITVRGLPTSFGPVSYTITAAETSVRASLDMPGRGRLRSLRLRLRLPPGARITRVTLDCRRLDRAGETIALPPLRGRHDLVATVVTAEVTKHR